jgi:hypothetical protein
LADAVQKVILLALDRGFDGKILVPLGGLQTSGGDDVSRALSARV